MNPDLAHIAARAFNTPLLIHPRKAEVISSVLAERIGLAPLIDIAAAQASGDPMARAEGRNSDMSRFDGEPRGPKVRSSDGGAYTQARYIYRGGVALVTIEGTLVNRGAWIGANSGLTSYEGIMAQIGSAATDPDVGTIILDLDSPGGEASGAFELADFVRKVAAEKPVVAHVNALAASAAYAMASGATRIVTSPSGLSGSIGVVMLHLDRSGQMAKQGIKPTLIFAGENKVDGNPFEALSDDVREQFQGEIDKLYGMFVDTVLRGRANLTADAVRATNARAFFGADAVAQGLADEVGTFGDILAQYSSTRTSPSSRQQRQTFLSVSSNSVSQMEHDVRLEQSPADASIEALASARIETARAAASLDERNPRLAAFADAVADGVSIAAAAKIAGRIEVRLSRLAANPPPAPRIDAGYAESASAENADLVWGRIVDGMNAAHGVVRPTR